MARYSMLCQQLDRFMYRSFAFWRVLFVLKELLRTCVSWLIFSYFAKLMVFKIQVEFIRLITNRLD